MSFHPALFTLVILLSICKSLVANEETIHGRIIDSQEIPVAQAHLSARFCRELLIWVAAVWLEFHLLSM
jgi:hypothetical protein